MDLGLVVVVKRGLERLHTDAAIGLQKRLAAAVAIIEIGLHDPFDRGKDLIRREAGASAVAKTCCLGVIAAKRDLVILDPGAVEAQNTDMADMVMPARVDAARNLDFQVADLMLQLEVVK